MRIAIAPAADLKPALGSQLFGERRNDMRLRAVEKDARAVRKRIEKLRQEIGSVEIFRKPAAVERARCEINRDPIVENEHMIESLRDLGASRRVGEKVRIGERHGGLFSIRQAREQIGDHVRARCRDHADAKYAACRKPIRIKLRWLGDEMRSARFVSSLGGGHAVIEAPAIALR